LKIVSYNVNGIKARMERLLEYLDEQKPDVVCLQELKGADETLPVKDIEAAGYGAVWHGQKGFNGVAVLARGAAAGRAPARARGRSRGRAQPLYRSRVGDLVVASIYLPNGNPQPGPKFDYKLKWMERLADRARALLAEERPVVLAGDYNVIPNDDDTFSVRAMASDALMQPESRERYRSAARAGLDRRAAHALPGGGIWTFWDYQAGAGSATRASASIICCSARGRRPASPARASTRTIAAANAPAITPRPG
jgi:exodeoxyribonuclease-3